MFLCTFAKFYPKYTYEGVDLNSSDQSSISEDLETVGAIYGFGSKYRTKAFGYI